MPEGSTCGAISMTRTPARSRRQGLDAETSFRCWLYGMAFKTAASFTPLTGIDLTRGAEIILQCLAGRKFLWWIMPACSLAFSTLAFAEIDTTGSEETRLLQDQLSREITTHLSAELKPEHADLASRFQVWDTQFTEASCKQEIRCGDAFPTLVMSITFDGTNHWIILNDADEAKYFKRPQSNYRWTLHTSQPPDAQLSVDWESPIYE